MGREAAVNRFPTKTLLWAGILCFGAIASAQTTGAVATHDGAAGLPAQRTGEDARPSINPVPKQTARQALLEMFFGQKPGAFEKHLPTAMHEFLKGGNSGISVNELLQAVNEIRQSGREMETFDEGPVLLHSRDSRTEQNIEISVESESDRGDEYEIRLAIALYRNGRPLPLPFSPTLICTMKTDSDVWRLDDLLLNLRVPVGDPDFLATLNQRIEATKVEPQEGAALRSLRSIATAEVSYAAAFPNVGFTCSLSDLGGTGASQPSPRGAMMLDSGFSNAVEGYTFSITDCSGSPAQHFQIMAVPQSTEDGQRAFCEDESGRIRYAEDGQAAACLSAGEPLP
jgi:hypothetical protein